MSGKGPDWCALPPAEFEKRMREAVRMQRITFATALACAERAESLAQVRGELADYLRLVKEREAQMEATP